MTKENDLQQQMIMEDSFLRTHRDFVKNPTASIDVPRKDISEAREMQHIYTDEWCRATESYLDDLAKMIYIISEPRWISTEDSDRIKQLRQRIHDLYTQYKGVAKAA